MAGRLLLGLFVCPVRDHTNLLTEVLQPSSSVVIPVSVPIPVSEIPVVPSRDVKRIFVMIPGNPGAARFYDEFLWALYEKWDRKVPVIAVSHAGHTETAAADHPTGDFDLNFQVDHKISVLRELHTRYPDARFVLAGHSIGAWIVLNILKRTEEHRLPIERCVQLFPTLHSMKQQSGALDYVTRTGARHVAASLAHAAGWLPVSVRSWLLRKFGPPSEATRSVVLNFWRYSLVQNCFYMARTEFDSVVTADWEALDQHMDKLIFYYGTTDGWVPLSHYEEMRERYPEAQVHLDDTGAAHAFCVSDSSMVAERVAGLLAGTFSD